MFYNVITIKSVPYNIAEMQSKASFHGIGNCIILQMSNLCTLFITEHVKKSAVVIVNFT